MKTLIARYGLVLFLILVFGCQNKVEVSNIVGIYTVKYPYGIEQLIIMPDGTYEQSFGLNGQILKSINMGRWEIRYLDGQQLILNEPVIVDDGFGKLSSLKKKAGIWPLHINKGFTGKLSFPINEDQGFIFKKVQ